MTHTPGPWKVWEANTRLREAAPALLEALEALIACDKNGRFGEPDFPKAIAKARAAIAIATEEKSQ